LVDPPRRAGKHHHHCAAAKMPRAQSGRKYLAVHARQLALEPSLQILRRSRRQLLQRLEQAGRSALAHHVHWTAPMGARVLIKGNWYYAAGLRAGAAMAERTGMSFAASVSSKVKISTSTGTDTDCASTSMRNMRRSWWRLKSMLSLQVGMREFGQPNGPRARFRSSRSPTIWSDKDLSARSPNPTAIRSGSPFLLPNLMASGKK